jgi:hypothetical protein
MSAPEPKALYLCLLDDLKLAEHVQLGDYCVRSYTADELSGLLRGRDDLTPTEAERSELELLACFPWASIEQPIPDYRQMRQQRRASGPGLKPVSARVSADGALDVDNEPRASLDAILAKCDPFVMARAGFVAAAQWGSKEPFDHLLRVLNLLKPSTGPILPRRMYFRPSHDIQTKAQVASWILSPPITYFYGAEGDVEGPYVSEYELGPDDQRLFEELARQLNLCLAEQPAAGSPSNTHLRIAARYFERGDERMDPIPESLQALEVLMSYDAALEALFILEEEKRDVRDKLARRVCAVLGDSLPAVPGWEQTKDGRYRRRDFQRTPSQLRSFIRRVFWLRSKVAHGVRTVEELSNLILYQPDCAIPNDGEGIPSGPYGELLVTSGAFPGFLVNLREVVRRCIRFFRDEHEQGRSREDTLRGLDPKPIGS